MGEVLTSIAAAAVMATIVGMLRVWREVAGAGIVSGPWRATLSDGGAAMTPTRRAVVAVTGLWAMRSTEAIYWTATTDSAGHRLRGNAEYTISGSDLPARWWSITVYRNLQFVPNAGRRYSYSAGSLQRQATGRWSVRLGPTPQAGDWIRTPQAGDWIPTQSGGLLSVTLRMYHPAAFDLAGLVLPRIDRAGGIR